ncbi:hypothetical protein JOD43_003514 [Pullulanibacillus pueri]|uniref:Alkaline ceramidase n=1 Tax=Pullulanibacillus pueri TaxID=1437324 RepID=A0A8J3ENJ7_9BACL|nr:neutral/alkaline non-lysosomal ceramidase N-terminal domain-containing protein [Pullulanibacillus pueri]MBM7683334.1 hypothetical protein [Pullulanibacillus pueri]GGH86364.1 alkaline ceramidase [Pullulanibacillus pueri]
METDKNKLRLGVAKVNITPTFPLPLAGFAHRIGVFKAVKSSLYARVFLFEDSAERYVLVSADLIWWGDSLYRAICREIEKYGIKEKNIMLHATHNHSGPQTSHSVTPSLGVSNPRYLSMLVEKVAEGVRRSIENLEPVFIERGCGHWSEGVNRRKIEKGKCIMAPNLSGNHHPKVTVIKLKKEAGTTKGLLVHATCHPTTSDENAVSSEFPGYAMEALEYMGEGLVAGFLQGFCGDVRPALIKEGHFFRGTAEDVKRVGQKLVETVGTILDQRMEPVHPSKVILKTKTIDLPFARVPSTDDLAIRKADSGISSEWARLLEQNGIPTTASLKLSYFSLSEKLTFMTANAEMLGAYESLVWEHLGHDVLSLGYTNGMIGYVPTAEQLKEGGYEAEESAAYFGLPSPYSEKVECLITKGLTEIKGN